MIKRRVDNLKRENSEDLEKHVKEKMSKPKKKLPNEFDFFNGRYTFEVYLFEG